MLEMETNTRVRELRGYLKLVLALLVIAMIATVSLPLTAGAEKGGTDHPECEGRIEIEVGALTFTVPEGGPFEVWSKAGNNDHINHGVLDAGTVITSGVFNQNNQEQEISHVDLCPIPEEPEFEIVIGGECLVNRDEIGTPLFQYSMSWGSVLTVNGVEYTHPVGEGKPALFGTNVWSVVFPDQTTDSGSFDISDEECAPAVNATTTTVTTTTTTVTIPVGALPEVEELPEIVVEIDEPLAIPAATTPSTLPFTGPVDNLGLWVLSGLAALGMGSLLLGSARRRDGLE